MRYILLHERKTLYIAIRIITFVHTNGQGINTLSEQLRVIDCPKLTFSAIRIAMHYNILKLRQQFFRQWGENRIYNKERQRFYICGIVFLPTTKKPSLKRV
jgi:hypothetical protein